MLNFPLTRRAFVAGTAALAAGGALTLAGCSVEQPIEPRPAPADPADDNAPTEPVAAQSGVARTLTAAVAYEGSDPNPIGTSSGVFLAAGWHVFEGLYELNMHTYRAECGLAADAPVQIDDLEYEVTLREDTVFSDGSPLTSADVVNAFERNGESDLYGAFLSFITAVSAPDERTVHFKLNAPMGSVLQERLALVRVFPATITDEELASKPVGSGPWCYETINAADGGRISFTANHRYTGPWPATCERMEWSVLLDDTRRTDELIDKDVMVMEAAPVVRAEELADAGATVEWVPGFNLPFLMFNCEKPPFDDVRVRQALLYAIDVDSLIGTYMAGHARAATSLLPDYFRHYHRAATVYSCDPEKARKLLAEAGVDTALVNDTYFPTYTARQSALMWLKIYEYLTTADTSAAQWLSDTFGKTEVSFLRNGALGTTSAGHTDYLPEEGSGGEEGVEDDGSDEEGSEESTPADGPEGDGSVLAEDAEGGQTLIEEDKTVASIGTNITVRNKAGWIDGQDDDAVCDSGIVTINGRDYLITIMTNAPDSAAGEQAFAHLARTLLEIRGDLV